MSAWTSWHCLLLIVGSWSLMATSTRADDVSIEGTVVDTLGMPVPNARVFVANKSNNYRPNGIEGQTARTDDQGRFRMIGLPPGLTWFGVASGDDPSKLAPEVKAVWGDIIELGKTSSLEMLIYGHVVDRESGKLAKNWRSDWRFSKGDSPVVVQYDSHGSRRLSSRWKPYLRIHADGTIVVPGFRDKAASVGRLSEVELKELLRELSDDFGLKEVTPNVAATNGDISTALPVVPGEVARYGGSLSFLVNVKGKSYGAIVLTNTYPDNIKALGKRLGEIMTRAQESGRKKLERYLNLANHELSKRLPKVQQFKLTDCRIVRQKPEGLTVTFKDAVDSTLMTIEHPLGGDPRIVTIHHNDGTQWRILDVGTTATTEANSKSFTD